MPLAIVFSTNPFASSSLSPVNLPAPSFRPPDACSIFDFNFSSDMIRILLFFLSF
ncbi:hypothetical protein M1GAS476_0227 [Streptococcus pyogenes M1 476]|nr:hypothetical protein M1GAS476_0227 [Streptococcus pyogenes M1 476]